VSEPIDELQARRNGRDVRAFAEAAEDLPEVAQQLLLAMAKACLDGHETAVLHALTTSKTPAGRELLCAMADYLRSDPPLAPLDVVAEAFAGRVNWPAP
jgi:hypothetical protein